MKFLIFIFLYTINLIECTVVNPSRCRAGDVKVDRCGNLCRCLGDGVQTACTKISCPAFEQIQRSPDVSEVWDALFSISRTSGKLFTESSVTAKRSRAVLLVTV
ncbi:hypothetical protein ILUMI_02991 [Ignelater luminosus]|uniref:Uncharacterized protein n=1 Tax=Ignelater luminosus TaxID=2038154 RepID=A0A8K0DCE7_IGNLU|nr:hypothetical protein ILUMI_02991 [Ignelater luminosus]